MYWKFLREEREDWLGWGPDIPQVYAEMQDGSCPSYLYSIRGNPEGISFCNMDMQAEGGNNLAFIPLRLMSRTFCKAVIRGILSEWEHMNAPPEDFLGYIRSLTRKDTEDEDQVVHKDWTEG